MAKRVRIYRQPKPATQSGSAGTKAWVLEFEPTAPQQPDPLMGWLGGGGTEGQLRLRFASAEEAMAYAQRQGLVCEVEPPPPPRFRPKTYSDNFSFGRMESWTH